MPVAVAVAEISRKILVMSRGLAPLDGSAAPPTLLDPLTPPELLPLSLTLSLTPVSDLDRFDSEVSAKLPLSRRSVVQESLVCLVLGQDSEASSGP